MWLPGLESKPNVTTNRPNIIMKYFKKQEQEKNNKKLPNRKIFENVLTLTVSNPSYPYKLYPYKLYRMMNVASSKTILK